MVAKTMLKPMNIKPGIPAGRPRSVLVWNPVAETVVPDYDRLWLRWWLRRAPRIAGWVAWSLLASGLATAALLAGDRRGPVLIMAMAAGLFLSLGAVFMVHAFGLLQQAIREAPPRA